MSGGLRVSVDLQPSLEVRLEAARELHAECLEHLNCDDVDKASELAYRAFLVLNAWEHPDVPYTGLYPTLVSDIGFALYCFLADHGVDALPGR